MKTTILHACVLAFAASSAFAQSADPSDPSAQATPLVHPSSRQPDTTTPDQVWKEANAKVAAKAAGNDEPVDHSQHTPGQHAAYLAQQESAAAAHQRHLAEHSADHNAAHAQHMAAHLAIHDGANGTSVHAQHMAEHLAAHNAAANDAGGKHRSAHLEAQAKHQAMIDAAARAKK